MRQEAGVSDTTTETMAFSVVHGDDAAFESGLRGYFAYRDLGIKAATGGKVGAHVIRAVAGSDATGELHRHALDFQMVYVLKGWVRFWYEGEGEVLLKPGSCVHQPPGIVHREMEHSQDLELIEITLPANFETEVLPE